MGWYGKSNGEVTRIKPPGGGWGSKPTKYKLAPCRKCGASQDNKKVLSAYFGFHDGKDGWIVICYGCGKDSGRYFKTEKEAVDDWNGDDTL